MTEIMLIKVNLRLNVTHDFGNLDVEVSSFDPIDTAQNIGVNFDPELSLKKQIDMVVKNCNFQNFNIYAIWKYLD